MPPSISPLAMTAKFRQSSVPMALLRSVLKQHVGDLRVFAPSNKPEPRNTEIPRVPLDIIIEIAEHLENSGDILNFSLASSRVYATLLPVLYASVDLRSSRACKHTLESLLRNSHEAGCIRQLVVRPNHVDRARSQSTSKPIDENWVAQAVIRLARAGCLSRLVSFFWDGSEMPVDDSLWATLRSCCPLLRSVGSNVGPKCINPDSELFRFTDLAGFTLTAKTLPDEWDTFLPPEPELPDQLWEMLIERSPRLEQLRIDVSQRSRRVWDTRRVVQGRWPLLRDLELGDCSMAGTPASSRMNMETPFMRFLAAHPGLERLRLPSLSSFPRAIVLAPTSLPKLREFSGNVAHIRGLPNLPHIKKLSLVHQPLSEKTVALVCGTLKHMRSLSSLSIWLHLDAQADHYGVFRTLFDASRSLKHLDIACSEAPWEMVEFISALRGSRVALESLCLTRVESPTAPPPDLQRIALRLATTNPSLRHISLRYAFTTWVFLDSIPYQRVVRFSVQQRTKRDGGPLVCEQVSLKRGRGSFYQCSRSFELPKWI
ncbi:Dna polymerase gamma [Mycena kentingensis (nom. inval.)]|nr:Dna polymerase gamma [Mycena kentingensis (nom. inval.)]